MNPEQEESAVLKRYWVTTISQEGITTKESFALPLLGGYKSTKKYGAPDYCPSATRHHRKEKEETGQMSNLIFFDSVATAVALGYSPCGNCWIKGDLAFSRWQEYLEACERLGVIHCQEPKLIRNRNKEEQS